MAKKVTKIRRHILDLTCVNDEDNIVFLEPDRCDKAIMGVSWDTDNYPHIVYNVELLIQQHIADGMTEDEAYEYHDYNTVRALVYLKPVEPVLMTHIQEA